MGLILHFLYLNENVSVTYPTKTAESLRSDAATAISPRSHIKHSHCRDAIIMHGRGNKYDIFNSY